MSDDFEEDVSASASDQQLSLFVNLDGFEGPIDLLLSLAREQKVDLGKISILPLAEQYLLYIETARDLNLEIAADYLVMAAWLAYLKSRLLLPDPEPEQASEFIDMTDALRYQLVRLESMQSAAKRLTDLPLLNRHRLVRGQPEEFERKEQIVWQARLYDLLSAYGGMVSLDEAEKLTIAATRLYSVQEAAGRLQNLLPRTPGWSELSTFLPANLSQPLDRRSAVASHFVASLELAKDGVVALRQSSAYAPLFIRLKESVK